MTVGEVIDIGIRIGFLAGVPGAVIWYVRDRRKDRAAAEVAEKTVPADVALKTLAADDARLGYIDRAMESERRSYRSAIADRDQEITRQRDELAHRDQMLAHRDQIIKGLREQVAQLESQLAEVTKQLSAVRDQLNELADDTSPEGDPR